MNSLAKAKKNSKLKIVGILGGKGVQYHLAQLGIGIGSLISVWRNAPFSGPLIIEHDGSKFATGIGIASKIMVRMM